jgi:hypothetical protein
MKQTAVALGAVVLVVVVIAAWAWYVQYQPPTLVGNPNQDTGNNGIVCTADAMQCPDGTWVGRSGPNCQFVCPGPTSTPSGGGILPYQSGIQGIVMLGPTCPVERMPPDPNCADKPYSALVAIFRTSDPVHAVVITRSDAQGHFQASLPPGSYTVGAGESNLPRCPQTPATVGPSGYTQITIMCDTGIR